MNLDSRDEVWGQTLPLPALLSGSAFKVGQGYILGLPVAGYLTWQGRMLENNGIAPPVPVELERDALREGRDTQLEKAAEVVRSL